jgi:hypothetical protein
VKTTSFLFFIMFLSGYNSRGLFLLEVTTVRVDLCTDADFCIEYILFPWLTFIVN